MPDTAPACWKRTPRLLAVFAVGAVLSSAPFARAAEPKPEDIEFFEKKVRPVLAARCFKCHGPTEPKAHFRLDSRADAERG